ncbi:MAG: EAL domain-containing protein [Oleiphilaceae bacterium]|nr:EAL domain-containing protein [Oleiphilaceae bacterium]
MAPQDSLLFADEGDQKEAPSAHQPWKILIVDDERDVHESTLLAIGRECICNRKLQFLHAYNAAEARDILNREQDIAVILLDVVMESDDAGLRLVHHIREELRLHDTRIVLRTGQPGYAPELDTISRYEINDYKSKSELTRIKLFTTLTAAIRAYAQIRALNLSRRGLETIIKASKELLYLRGYGEFASGVITQLAGLLHLPEEGLVCVKQGDQDLTDRGELKVIAAAGSYSQFVLKPLNTIHANEVVELVFEAARTRQNLFLEDATCLYFGTQDGSEMLVYLASGTYTREEDRQLLELFSTNISACIDNVRLLEQRHEYAYQDQLLGIPNRLSFLQAIDTRLLQQTPDQMIVLIDIDQFGALNDTIGSQNGDRLLKQIAVRLQQHFRQQLVARISGDTFAILGESYLLKPEAISAVFEQAFSIANNLHMLSATQGRVMLEQQEKATDVIAQANVALKRAKQTLRGGYQDYHQSMFKETESRVQLLQGLRQAFDHKRLFMVYQPKIDLSTSQITGLESLMRWRSDEGIFVAPMDFIPVAETSGLIVPLGEWALRVSLVRIGQLRRDSGLDLNVSVNVSMVQFAHPSFLDMLDDALAFAEAEPDWLELEITESFAMHDQATVQQLIENIHQRGIRISIDDFGTGFSSLSYLENLKVHSLKIDKSFVDRIGTPDADTRIPETVLSLGKALDLTVVAEGIETAEQYEWLKQHGCHLGQGYYFAKPLTDKDVKHWLQEYAANHHYRASNA